VVLYKYATGMGPLRCCILQNFVICVDKLESKSAKQIFFYLSLHNKSKVLNTLQLLGYIFVI